MKPASTTLLDADITGMPEEGLWEMMGRSGKATVEGRSLMVVAPWLESDQEEATYSASGIRSFSLPALYKVTHSRWKGKVKGFGLEVFFDSLFKGDKRVRLGETGFSGGGMHSSMTSWVTDSSRTSRGHARD